MGQLEDFLGAPAVTGGGNRALETSLVQGMQVLDSVGVRLPGKYRAKNAWKASRFRGATFAAETSECAARDVQTRSRSLTSSGDFKLLARHSPGVLG